MDAIVMRLWDAILSFPSLLLAFIFVAVFGKSSINAVMALGVVYIPMISKLSRSMTMTEITKTYVEAAHSLGYSDRRIIFVHILPNCIGTMLAELTLDVGSAIMGLASLSFLGLGVQPPTPTWGGMISD
ncbi:MAG TPA: ABC transporter permease, partial [Lachnospiraceae bacterium]|nr:ABC transporter permease [Lachnospiraceae bacterium]